MDTAQALLQRPESRFIQAGAHRTHYVERGHGESVVLIHGGGPGADGWGNWHSCLPLLARSYRCIAVDMLGFGSTAKPDPATFTYSQAARTDHMIACIEALGGGKVSLIGNSMGGATALGVAMRRPDLVSRIVLMGSAGLTTTELPKALGPLMQYDGTVEGMVKVVRALTHPRFRMDDAMVEYRVAVSKTPGTMEALKATMAWVKSNGLSYPEEAISAVKTPALIVGGKDDPISTLDQAYRFLALLENSRGYLLPNTGHWVMIERPQEFCAAVEMFLRLPHED
jgi:2-hydroxy-6-oxo-6-(2'-aminophenyl)hexa-2,4-dienoate hydrolase